MLYNVYICIKSVHQEFRRSTTSIHSVLDLLLGTLPNFPVTSHLTFPIAWSVVVLPGGSSAGQRTIGRSVQVTV
jgi:hypothetical protein